MFFGKKLDIYGRILEKAQFGFEMMNFELRRKKEKSFIVSSTRENV